jgi:alpha-beta hydrolase superfamily lysophospholipase
MILSLTPSRLHTMTTPIPFKTPNDETLAIQDWSQTANQSLRGQVLLVHGLGEHMGRYAHVIKHLNDWGFAVRTYDQYGHGKSSGNRGCLPSPHRLIDDLALVIDDTRKKMAAQNTVNTPLVLLGHSMGGLVAARFVSLAIRPVDALVLSSPALGAKLKAVDKLLLAVLPKIVPNLAVPNGLDASKISHDPEVVKAYLADPLVHNKISPRLGKWIMDNGAATIESASTWHVPTLLMYAGQDKLVDAAASRTFTSLAPKSMLQSTCYENLYHEIFNEVDASSVFGELKAWLDARF